MNHEVGPTERGSPPGHTFRARSTAPIATGGVSSPTTLRGPASVRGGSSSSGHHLPGDGAQGALSLGLDGSTHPPP